MAVNADAASNRPTKETAVAKNKNTPLHSIFLEQMKHHQRQAMGAVANGVAIGKMDFVLSVQMYTN